MLQLPFQCWCFYHQMTWQISLLIIAPVSEFFCSFSKVAPITKTPPFLLVINLCWKTAFWEVFWNFSNSAQYKTNCILPEQLKNTNSSLYWYGRYKEVSYHRPNGYEQTWLTGRYFSERKELYKTRECTFSIQKILWKVLCVIFCIYTKAAGLLGSLSSWAC